MAVLTQLSQLEDRHVPTTTRWRDGGASSRLTRPCSRCSPAMNGWPCWMTTGLPTTRSGAGKSSLLHELAARGYRTVDTDCGDYFQTIDGERVWREDRISALLSSAPDELPGVLFIQGTTRNQVLFSPRFDHIVLLSAPHEILAGRLATRTTNPYGKDPAELAETLQ
jgi:hypothetical protein